MTRHRLPLWQPPIAKQSPILRAEFAEGERKLMQAVMRHVERESERIAMALWLADLPRSDYADLAKRAEHARLTGGVDAMVATPVGYEPADLVLAALRRLGVAP